jgi:tetratricopeptide (TPR) repeat protein
MQGLFILGLILPLPYLFFGFVEGRIRLPWQRQEQQAPRATGLKRLAIVYAIMVCVIFANPYGADLALYPVTLLGEISNETAVAATNVAEFLPSLASPDLNRAEHYLKWMIYLSSFSFVLNIRRLNPTHVSLFAAFLYLGLTAQRNVAIFAIIATPMTIVNIDGFLDDLSNRFPRLNLPHYLDVAQIAVTPVILAGIVFMLVQIATDAFYIRDGNTTRFGFGLARHNYPIKAANFVEAAGLSGRMFNNPWCGGYLIWRFHPERQVYFDGRWEVYGEQFFERYLQLQNDPALFEEEAARFGIDHVLLYHTVGYVDTTLIEYLTSSPGWQPIYFDEVSVVFVRNLPEYADLIQKYRVDFNTFEREKDRIEAALPAGLDDAHLRGTNGLLARLTDRIPGQAYPMEDIARANFYVKVGYYDNARRLFERALTVYPDAEIAHSGLGVAYWQLGLHPFAMAEFKTVEQLNPRSVSNLINLGQLNLLIGPLDEAERYFEKARKLDRRNVQASLYLAGIYLRTGQPDKAAQELRHALKLQPDLREAEDLLRRIERR